MNFSDIISRGFRTLKRGSLWGFVLSTYGATILLFIVAGVVAVMVAGSAIIKAISHGGSGAFGAASLVGPIVFAAGVFLLAIVLSIPIGLIAYGGLIHQTDEAQAGRGATVGDAWRFGAKRMGRVFVVEFIIGLVGFAITLVAVVPIILVIAAASGGSSDRASVGIVFGICGGSLLVLLLIFGLWLLSGLESLSIRYALIGDRSATDAIGAAWQAYRARFGNVFLMLLIVFGFRLVVSMVQSILNYMLQFAGFGTAAFSNLSSNSNAAQSFAVVMRAMPFLGLIYVFGFVLTLLALVLTTSLWTAFFRQMTGLDRQPTVETWPGYIPPVGGIPVTPQAPTGPVPTYAPPPVTAPAYQPPIGPPMAPAAQPPQEPAPEPPAAPGPPAG